MLYKKDIFVLALITLISIGFISYFTVFHINSLRNLNELAKEKPGFEPVIFYDLNNKKIMDNIILKIRHYESIIKGPIIHLDHEDSNNLEKEKAKLRSLAESNVFENTRLIDPNKDNYYYIMYWISQTAKQFSSNIILYPYSFNYSYINEENTSTIRQFTQGAFISLNASEAEKYNHIGLNTQGTIATKKARAIFNSDFAILSIEFILDYNKIDVFQDLPDWNQFFGNYYGKTTQSNYSQFIESKTKDPSKTYVTTINENDIINGNLLNNGIPRFGLLIIPDYMLGTDTIIISKLTQKGIDNIVDFYNKGGKILVNGKSGTLLEDFNLMKKGVYNRKKLLNINNANRKVRTKGCEETFGKTYKENSNDFEKQVICMNIPYWREVTLASSFKSEAKDPNYATLINLDSSNNQLVITDTDDGLTYNLTEKEKEYNPLFLFKKNNKNGNIYVMNYSPVMAGGERVLVTNTINLALSKDLYMTSNVKMNIDVDPDLKNNLPIPAGEFGFQLEINILIHNLDDKEMSAANLYLFLNDNLDWASIPKNCENRTYNDKEIPDNIKKRKSLTNKNNYLLCNLNTIPSYEKLDLQVNITVLNSQATQLKYQVLLIEDFLTYKDSNTQTNLLFDQIKTNCEAAPLLRGSLNPDPSSFYPFLGSGYYVDNVLKIENKEDSLAYDVEYYGLIPLASPIVDGVDQRKTQWSLKIYVDYYNNNNFEVPFTSDNAEDYIYPVELKGKGITIVAEWDSPVLPNKEIYSKKDVVLGEIVEIKGINIGSVTINSTSEVIRQVNYRKSDRFYKLASQRLMVFIDTSTPEGAYNYYRGKIPNDILDPIYEDRTKRDFLYSRLDIYFYDNPNYCNPPGISEKHVISIDKYETYQQKPNCSDIRGEITVKPKEPGFFNNFDDNKKKTILQPNIYPNALFELCNLIVIDPEKEEISKYLDTDYFKLVHYIIPNVDKNITQPNQIYGFTQMNKHYGYHSKYNSIKFIYLHSLTYVVDSKYCKYGGRIIIDIGNFEISSTDDVTVSPDQIAVYKVEYNKKKISIYFKRGLMSNEQFGKNLTLNINIENINIEKNTKFKFIVEEMKFDISNPPDFEIYSQVISEDIEFAYISAFSYPAVQMKTVLNRTLNGYETIEPFSRYGVYAQELFHRTVYAYAEAHNQRDPGVTGNGDGFSFISNLGISSIPFIEYMHVGTGQVIPAGPATSRVSWKDIWGRNWHQPLRSLFPDIPPVPPPLKNFMMTTTYEIVRSNNQQVYEWDSDEDVKIHIQMKLLNNYPKYFEITRCKENQIRYVPYYLKENHEREYANTSKENFTQSELNGNNMFLRQGGMASYGICFAKEGAYVSGNKVEGDLLKQIEKARLCADLTDANLIAKCEEELSTIKTISKSSTEWDEEKDGKWNYSPLVEDYYPKGYIEPDMWQLTHIDYYDNAMDKAYKYHVDNQLPNYDNFKDKPLNTIAVPLYKGLGYNIVYDKNVNFQYHGETKHGWWSDNLQNKDDTLIAGINTCNKISVDKKSSLVWVDGKDLVGSKRAGSDAAAKEIIKNRQKNIYTCLFNRKRPQYNPENGKSYFASNVVENNIIPIVNDLDKDDKRLTEFECNVDQYTEKNIYTFDGNYLATPTSKDYLYFAANLRGHAKETINVVMTLKKFDKIVYEGSVKINEGGRFVYWNPVNGPNSFLVVDDPVSVIQAKRNDLIIINNIYPRRVSTFNSIIYHTYIIRDDNKINKEWPYMNYYSDSHGYGDVTISVNVGGIKKSKAALQPGETTYAKIIFYNNCGFDWNMKYEAITFNYTGTKRLNANDYLFNIVHAIRVPIEYNFMNYVIEKEYQPYISIGPSGHNVEVAPEFFDFENINVVTIRDGFKGEYNLQINVSRYFPDELRGKPIEIKLELNKTYFDHFPGEDSDPIKFYHKYNVTIPSIYIAVPYNKGEFKDKVLYISAQSTNVNIQFNIGIDWTIDGIKYIDKTILEEISNATQEEKYKEKLDQIWNKKINNTGKNIGYEETILSDTHKKVLINGIKEEYEFFPKKNKKSPDVTELIIIVRSSVSQIPYGNNWPLSSFSVTHLDWLRKYKYRMGTSSYVTASGAWITITYSRVLVDYLGNGNYIVKPDQQLSPDESGTIKVQFKLTNIGNGESFDTKFEIVIQPNLTLVEHMTGANKLDITKRDNGQTILTFDYGAPIMPQELKGGILYLNYTKICDNYDILSEEEKSSLPKALPVAKESSVYMRLENSSSSDIITQHLRQPLTFAYTIKKKTAVYIDLVISGKRSDPTLTIKPKINFYGNDTKDNVQIYIGKLDLTNYYGDKRQLEEIEDNSINYSTIYSKNIYTNEQKDKPIQIEKENKNHVFEYIVVAYAEDGTAYHNAIKYEQKKVHISDAEVALIILSLIFFAASAFFIWRGYINYTEMNSNQIENNVKNAKIQKLLSE